MAFWEEFNADETQAEIECVIEVYDDILKSLGADMIVDSGYLDYGEYMEVKKAVRMGKCYFKVESAKIKALEEIQERLIQLDTILDGIEARLVELEGRF